jgi:hypothetical protein
MLVLVGCLLAAAALSAQAPEKRYALVIGNGEYKDLGSLANPVNDAADMAKAFKGVGFEVVLLTNASRKQMNQALNDFHDRLAADAGSAGVFWYAGHGVDRRRQFPYPHRRRDQARGRSGRRGCERVQSHEALGRRPRQAQPGGAGRLPQQPHRLKRAQRHPGPQAGGQRLMPCGIFLSGKARRRFRAKFHRIDHEVRQATMSEAEASRRLGSLVSMTLLARARCFRNTVCGGQPRARTASNGAGTGTTALTTGTTT